jgi:hypothetical protein
MLATRGAMPAALPSRLMLRTCNARASQHALSQDQRLDLPVICQQVKNRNSTHHLDLELQELHVVDDLVQHRRLVRLENDNNLTIKRLVSVTDTRFFLAVINVLRFDPVIEENRSPYRHRSLNSSEIQGQIEQNKGICGELAPTCPFTTALRI